MYTKVNLCFLAKLHCVKCFSKVQTLQCTFKPHSAPLLLFVLSLHLVFFSGKNTVLHAIHIFTFAIFLVENYFKTESINKVIRLFEECFRDRIPPLPSTVGGLRFRNRAIRLQKSSAQIGK